ncbi:C39 family peptidase [Streptomyces mirabilis]|uniref:C39 family peptidase n=1 Tax=Streptomyces mirabilis TaxID=68239 RepID=UPI003332AAB6
MTSAHAKSRKRWLRRVVASVTVAVCSLSVVSAATANDDHHSQPRPKRVNEASAGTWSYASHPDLTQTLPYNCIPTAASMALASMGVNLTPADLGHRMNLIKDWGVSGDDLMRVYNQVQPDRRELTYEVVTSARQVEADLSVDLLHHVAVPALVIAAGLPWQGGEITGHAVVVDGMNPARHLVRVFDPAPRNGGEHVLTTEQLLNALQMESGVRRLLVDQELS